MRGGTATKSTEKQAEFIELRSSGKSYSQIAEELQISKSTCSAWAEKLEAQIAERRDEKLEELNSLYAMDKASRLERMGKTLQSINTALQGKDLSELPADELLKLQLRYEEALRAEYTEPTGDSLKAFTTEEIITALSTLYRKQESGEIKPAQAKAQLSTLSFLLQAETRKEADNYNSRLYNH